MPVSNFRVTAILGSPIAGALEWISLDGLLAWAVFRELAGPNAFDLQGCSVEDAVDIPLPLNEVCFQDKCVWTASFAVYDSVDSTWRYKKRWDEMNDSLVDFKGKRERIQTDGLFFKAIDMPTVLRSTQKLIFFARGWSAEVYRLLTEYIHHIGKRRSQGHGQVIAWTVEEIQQDWSLWWHDIPMRPIPVTDDPPTRTVEYCGFRPPYRAMKNQGLCYVPAAESVVYTSDLSL